MYGNAPDAWHDSLTGIDRLRFITNAFTRMRYCHLAGYTGLAGFTGRTGYTGLTGRTGRPDFSAAGPPGTQDPSLAPWFALRDADADGVRIVFGHWATLQIETALSRDLHVRHVDTGCVWGGSLTALRLEDDREFSVDCTMGRPPEESAGMTAMSSAVPVGVRRGHATEGFRRDSDTARGQSKGFRGPVPAWRE